MSARFSDRSALEAYQLSRLQELFEAVLVSNPFYRDKLVSAGCGTPPASLGEFFERVPFTTKEELVRDHQSHQPYGSNLTYPVDDYTRCHQTSGSTGRPMRWLDTNVSWASLLESWGEVYREAKVNPGDRIFFAFSFGPFLGFWTAFESALKIGCLCLPGGGLSSEARLQSILANESTILCCTPTYALRLAEVAAEKGVDLSKSKIRLIIVAGEPGGSLPATRAAISSAWHGARVFDHHGMTEVGPVTHECYSKPGVLRVIESAYLAEVIDPKTGKHMGSGHVGELVLTTLERIGSPLIRYRTGDLVKALPGDRNPDGRVDLCLEGGILGRVDDMITVRGVNVYPSAVDQLIRECGGIDEYQVRVSQDRGLAEIEIRIESGGDAVAAERLSELLQSRLSLRVPVRLVDRDTLPRFEMKASRWVAG